MPVITATEPGGERRTGMEKAQKPKPPRFHCDMDFEHDSPSEYHPSKIFSSEEVVNRDIEDICYRQ